MWSIKSSILDFLTHCIHSVLNIFVVLNHAHCSCVHAFVVFELVAVNAVVLLILCV